MSAPRILKQTFETQEVMINTESKVLRMELNNMFRKAGQILKWPEVYGKTAFGINRSIMNFVIGSKFKLLIKFNEEPTKEYWINYDKLRDFKKSVYCITLVSKGKTIYNIPTVLFVDKPNFSGIDND